MAIAMTRFQRHSENLIRQEAERDRLKALLVAAEEESKERRAEGAVLERAREIINEVLILTQGSVRKFVEDVVTLALSAVYGDEYRFELEYNIARNRSEAIPWITKGGERVSPREEVGGGVLDIVSLSLRLVVWALLDPRPAPVFILDEPAKFLSRDLQAAFGRMLKDMSELLGLQIILVSHSTDIIEQADKAYEVSQAGGVSTVEEIEVG